MGMSMEMNEVHRMSNMIHGINPCTFGIKYLRIVPVTDKDAMLTRKLAGSILIFAWATVPKGSMFFRDMVSTETRVGCMGSIPIAGPKEADVVRRIGGRL